VESNYKGKKKI